MADSQLNVGQTKRGHDRGPFMSMYTCSHCSKQMLFKTISKTTMADSELKVGQTKGAKVHYPDKEI